MDEDIVFFFQGSSLLAKYEDEETLVYPQYKEFVKGITLQENKDSVDNYTFIYLLSVDDTRYFLAEKKGELLKGQYIGEMADASIHKEYAAVVEGFDFVGVNSFRKAKPKATAFAAITAYHIYGWYRDNHFCGRCGGHTVHDSKERMVRCTSCGNMIFPKICPAVIVAVTDNDRILLTKYAGRMYRNYALIAGFNEAGETLEQTVEREVMEEVGLKVKNIRYYKSQPWGLSGSLLSGFFCELDGDDKITLQEDELSLGTWVKADELDLEDDGISLTREMIIMFWDEYKNIYL
uniref:NAD(+) diphosphatase n=1 Tax=Lachnospira sp. TaxID=2049031 RepID=UPI0040277D64